MKQLMSPRRHCSHPRAEARAMTPMKRVLSPAGAALVASLVASLAAPTAAQAQHSQHTRHTSRTEHRAMKNIVQVASAAGSFTTLVAAVEAAGLAETLQGEGPFTVFAPTDAAFAKLPKGTLQSLLRDKEAQRSVLTYHVVVGRVPAADILAGNGASPETVNGEPLEIRVQGGKVYVNGAQVVTADVPASNGVIHAIDTVLLPKPASTPAGR